MIGLALVILATALGAQIEPLASTKWADLVPGTLQTLGVLVGGAVLGPKRGALAMLMYLGLGLLGLPVFYGWSSYSLAQFAEYHSAGYLIGFVPAASYAGAAARRYRGYWTLLVCMLLAHLLILALGVPVLAAYTGWDAALQGGLLALLPGMSVKSLLAAALIYWAREVRKTSSKAA
jgi:biotin transport system substrate-specific component